MKITGTIDTQDRITWINWHTDNPQHGPRCWWNRLFVPIALILPPLLFYVLDDNFHWGTYAGVIICWSLLFCCWRFLNLVLARRKTKLEDETYPFRIERRGSACCLSTRRGAYEYPSDTLGVIRLKHNLIITVDHVPICITPRNENIDGEKTVDDIENLIKEPR